MINNKLSLMRYRIGLLDARAVLAASTMDTLFEVLVVTSIAKTATECIFDGGEIGSTAVVKTVPRPKAKTINANDNFVVEARLAA